MPKLLLATGNQGKLRELKSLFRGLPYELVTPSEAGISTDVDETGSSLEENATLKATAAAARSRLLTLADDSGLEVDALSGAPGVYSARYAGAGDSRGDRDQRNNEKLLRVLENVPLEQRTARFVCAMCLCDPDGSILAESRGEFDGLIARDPRGDNGFGYDPLLFLPDRGCTSAELSPEEKNARSHRGQAARAMGEFLRGRSPAQP